MLSAWLANPSVKEDGSPPGIGGKEPSAWADWVGEKLAPAFRTKTANKTPKVKVVNLFKKISLTQSGKICSLKEFLAMQSQEQPNKQALHTLV